MSRRFNVLFLLLALTLPGTQLLADNGRIEINQSSIDAAGGFPYSLSLPGSYVLTSNLENPSKDIHALIISAAKVQLDLNGFRIKGPITCTPTCSDLGAGVHILVAATDAVIRNGTLRGAGGSGIFVNPEAARLRLERVRMVENGEQGVYAASTPNVVVLYSSAYRNGSDGLFLGTGARVEENVLAENAAAGVAVFAGARIVHNYVASNGQSGIKAFGASTVLENYSVNNTHSGIEMHGNGGYGGNLVDGNTAGTIALDGAPETALQLSPNACNGNTTCP
jgi:hypothetical protein